MDAIRHELLTNTEDFNLWLVLSIGRNGDFS